MGGAVPPTWHLVVGSQWSPVMLGVLEVCIALLEECMFLFDVPIAMLRIICAWPRQAS